MDTGQRRSDQNAEGPGDTDNVVRFPRDWFGPIDELVPFGPSAPDPHSDLDPDAFWGEDAETIHDVVAVREVNEPRARYRPRAVHVLVAVAAVGLGGAALVGRFEGAARVSSGHVVDRSAALANVTSMGRVVEGSQASQQQTPRRPALMGSRARPRPHHHTARTSPPSVPATRVVEARVTTPAASTHSVVSDATPTSVAQLAYTGTGASGTNTSSNGSAATTAAGGGSGAGVSGGGSGAVGSGGGSGGGGASAGPEGPGAPFGPGHMG